MKYVIKNKVKHKRMNKNFTKKQIDLLNIFLKQELKSIDDQILLNKKKSNKSSKNL